MKKKKKKKTTTATKDVCNTCDDITMPWPGSLMEEPRDGYQSLAPARFFRLEQ